MTSGIRRQSTHTLFTTICLLLCLSDAVTALAISRTECSTPPPGTIFCEDFEGVNPKSHFDDYDGNLDTENQITADLGPANDTANKVILLRVPAGQAGGSDLVKVLPSTYDSLYVRWYFKYETGFNFTALNHGGGLAAGDRNFIGGSGNQPDGTDFAGFYVQYAPTTVKPYAYSYYRGMYQDCTGPGSCFGDSLPCLYDSGATYCTKAQHRPSTPLPTLVANQWYCFEELVSMGTPSTNGSITNGRLQLWLDTISLGNFTDLWVRTVATLKVQNLWLSLYHHDGTHSVGGEMIDNIVVSTQQIGCGSAPSDTTPPATPVNLRIQ